MNQNLNFSMVATATPLISFHKRSWAGKVTPEGIFPKKYLNQASRVTVTLKHHSKQNTSKIRSRIWRVFSSVRKRKQKNKRSVSVSSWADARLSISTLTDSQVKAPQLKYTHQSKSFLKRDISLLVFHHWLVLIVKYFFPTSQEFYVHALQNQIVHFLWACVSSFMTGTFVVSLNRRFGKGFS